MQSERPNQQELALIQQQSDGRQLSAYPQHSGYPLQAGSYSRHQGGANGGLQMAGISQRMGGEDTVPISQYLSAINRHKWRIFLFAILCGVITLIVSLRVTPLYESTAVIDIDRNGDVDAVGSESRSASSVNAEQFITTQMRLMESDAVLRPVAMRHNLPLEQPEPWFAPIREDVARAREMAPAALKNLKVTHPPQTFLIYIRYRSADPQLAAQVANEIAQSYIDHVFRIRFESSQTLSQFMEKQLEELRAKMESSNAALAAFERQLNMIDPEERTSIMSSRLLQLNTEFTQAQAERVKREAAFRALSQGSMEAATISAHGQQLQDLQRRQQELRESFAKVMQHYGQNHPAYASAKAELDQVTAALESTTASVQRQIGLGFEESIQREALLDKELLSTKTEFDRLNANSFQYRSLKRDADADRKLYEELVAKTKQATINSGFPSSAIRLADMARPAYAPVSPNIRLNLLLSVIFGLLLSAGVALVADTLDSTVRDPETVSAVLGSEVLGLLPKVRSAGAGLVSSMLLESGSQSQALVKRDGTPGRSVLEYLEAVKTLHASLMLADLSQRLRTLMVTSASPAEGKSTVATTIAISHASKGKRVLLVDGDLRRPSIADKLDVPNRRGLVDVCLRGEAWRDVVTRMPGFPEFDVLATGICNRRAVDQLPTVLADVLAEAATEYDLVVVDSPPLLGFPEPLHMAALVDGVLLVALAGRTNRKALQLALNQLRRIGAQALGVVINATTRETNGSYYYQQYGAHDRVAGSTVPHGASAAEAAVYGKERKDQESQLHESEGHESQHWDQQHWDPQHRDQQHGEPKHKVAS